MESHPAYLKHALLCAATLFALAAEARAQRFEHQEIIPHTFTVSPGQLLHLTSDLGSIQVIGGNGNQVEIEVIKGVEGGSESNAEDLFRRFTVDIEQSSRGVEVRGNYDGERFRGGRNGLRVIYQIRVPRRFDLNLNTAGGSITVEELEGDARMHTSGGSIALVQIDGTVNAHTSGGSISAEEIGGNTRLETSGGSISVRGVDGTALVNTSGGSISAEEIAGDLEAETSGGSINLDDIRGSVKASTSGGGIVAELTEQPQGPVRLSTSGGSVTVRLDSDIKMNVEAHASGGGVRTELPISGRMERNSIQGTINGGGPLLSLHSSGGGVVIGER